MFFWYWLYRGRKADHHWSDGDEPDRSEEDHLLNYPECPGLWGVCSQTSEVGTKARARGLKLFYYKLLHIEWFYLCITFTWKQDYKKQWCNELTSFCISFFEKKSGILMSFFRLSYATWFWIVVHSREHMRSFLGYLHR